MGDATELDEAGILPLDERITIALLETGIDEGDTETALGVVIPLVANDLRALAAQLEWRHRSMTFYRGGCGANSRLHPVGQDIRAYADQLDNGATHE